MVSKLLNWEPSYFYVGALKDCFMETLSLRRVEKPKKQIKEMYAALSGFTYKDGYKFSAIDLGDNGIKIQIGEREF